MDETIRDSFAFFLLSIVNATCGKDEQDERRDFLRQRA
jgi:hypothetical protein